MEGRSIELVKVSEEGDLEVTTGGIQFLQNLNRNISVVCVTGSSMSGKSTLANKIANCPSFQVGSGKSPTTRGFWIHCEAFQVQQKDETGRDFEADLLVLDCQALGNSQVKLFALASLLSSHLIYVTGTPVEEESLEELEFLLELPSWIQVQKNQDSKLSIHNFMPSLTWVVSGVDLKITDNFNSYLEKALTKQPSDSHSISSIKTGIRHFFRKRAFFNLSLEKQQSALVEHVHKSTGLKRIGGKRITGAILCNMLQAFVHRFQKSSPAVIVGAFERAVAAEARRCKEKVFINYLDKMGLIEEDLPCEDEHLQKEHNSTARGVVKDFDELMMAVFDQEEVQEERNSLLDRIETYFEDLKQANFKASETKCRTEFKKAFDAIKQTETKYEEDSSTGNVEKKLLGAIQQYQNSASGPCVDLVFSEEISFVVPYMSSLLRELQNLYENQKDELEREVKNLTRNKDEARAGEKRLRELLEETNKNYEKQLEQRDKQISELQANVNTRIHMAENKSKNQAREIQGLKLELEQAQKEKEMVLDAERDMYEKRVNDLESKLFKLQTDNSKYEKLLDDLREDQEKLIADKNEQINDLSRRLKLMETQSDASPRKDTSILRNFREYLDDIFNKFNKEQNLNSKYLQQLERVRSIQDELNQTRLSEQEAKNRLIEDYEDKIKKLQQDREQDSKKYSQLLEKQQSDLSVTYDNVKQDIEQNSLIVGQREEQIKRLVEEKNELSNELSKREQQLSDQYEVLQTYKKNTEQLEIEIENVTTTLNRVKIEKAEENDDNDLLIELIGFALEMQQKKKHQPIPLGKIQNHHNREKIIKIFRRLNIHYE